MRLTSIQPRLVAWLLLLIAFPGEQVFAATPSELLEKGIYAEETVGDLDAAIQVYQEVVREAKQSAQSAAEAQFRIGVCYEKQGKEILATAAFQAVVDDFPDETTLVNQAKTRLKSEPELIAVPWGDGDEMHLEMKLQTGLGVGMQVMRVAKSSLNGKPAWECNQWQVITINGQRSKSQVFADPKTFAPIQSSWMHTLLGKAKGIYDNNQVTIELINKNETTSLNPEGLHFDNEQAAEVFRRLPLKVGYKPTLNIVSTLGAALIPLEMEVTKTETLEVPAGTFDCFRLELSIGQTFWISNDEHRYIVKFEAGGVSASLLKVAQPNAGEGTSLTTDRYETVLPVDWFSYTPTGQSNIQVETTHLIDPMAELNTKIEAKPLRIVRAKHDTPVAWLQSTVNEMKERVSGFTLGTGGVTAVKVGGRDAAAVEVEFKDDGKQMKARRVVVFGETFAVTVRQLADADAFERTESQCQQIVDRLVVK